MMLRNIAVFAIFFTMGFISMAQENWKLVKDKEGIKVYTRSNDVMSFKEFKATMVVHANIHQFLSVLYDVDGLSSWAYNITEATLVSRESERHQVYHAVAKAPWPYKNRDGVYSNKINWDSTLSTLTIDIELVENYIQPKNDFVRMDGYGFWKFRELSSGATEVLFQMQIDPGGSIKAWLANMFTTDSPFETLIGLQKEVLREKHRNKSFDLIMN